MTIYAERVAELLTYLKAEVLVTRRVYGFYDTMTRFGLTRSSLAEELDRGNGWAELETVLRGGMQDWIVRVVLDDLRKCASACRPARLLGGAWRAE